MAQSADEILDAIRRFFAFESEQTDTPGITCWGDLHDLLYTPARSLIIDGVDNPIFLIDTCRGYDEDPSWMIFYIGGQHYGHSGWYSSHEGYMWEENDDLVEVVSKTRTETYWEAR